jgi:hypothetical protein
MDAIVRVIYGAVLGAFDRQVAPVAAAYDETDPGAVEEGRRTAVARAATVRVHIAAPRVNCVDALAAYEAATSLLSDLWVAAQQAAHRHHAAT